MTDGVVEVMRRIAERVADRLGVWARGDRHHVDKVDTTLRTNATEFADADRSWIYTVDMPGGINLEETLAAYIRYRNSFPPPDSAAPDRRRTTGRQTRDTPDVASVKTGPAFRRTVPNRLHTAASISNARDYLMPNPTIAPG
ncbi:hypothetical protein AB0B25_26495 [Nocardia sp. NPDC049190]|uniref:hypothetical protein n=1 Tax=Nocardia sp. NPDC049190 TaxID=3155650 RepID=UPI00340BCFB1